MVNGGKIDYNPVSWQEWQELAFKRGVDADRLLQAGSDVAAVYMAGYVVECALKALWLVSGFSPPRSGKHGHDLLHLWQKMARNLRVVAEQEQSGQFFLQQWSTDLRYCRAVPVATPAPAQLIRGAKRLFGLIQQAIRQQQSKANRR
ncbi:MAG: HEPN domain-containing protein [Magnetococcales bacterium]|nr:HEPN domain-containing protein [Magnetococcales bacterium]